MTEGVAVIITANSIYEVRPAENLIRIVPGETDRLPTKRFQPAGEWKEYVFLGFNLERDGLHLVVNWPHDDAPEMKNCTITSAIQDIPLPEPPDAD